MAEPKIDIKITTTADPKGAQIAGKSLNDLQKELKETQKQMKAVDVASPEFARLKDQAVALKEKSAELKDEIKQLGGAKEKTAVSASNFGQAVFQGSRAVQDFSEAGIRGMVNNVEGISSALGLGASAAGGFTLAFVALEVVMRNWDTWFGEEKATQAKEFWSAMTPDEAQMTRLRETAELQDRIAENIERIGAARQKEIEQQQALADLWKGITPTPEERGDLPPLPGMAGPNKDTAAAGEKYATAAALAIQADDAYKAQQKRVADIAKIASLDERIKMANTQDERRLAGLDTSFDDAGMPNSPAMMEEAQRIRAGIKQRSSQMRSQIQSVPGLTDGLTGDEEKDRVTLQQRAAAERERLNQLDNERRAAALAAQGSGQDYRNAQQRESEGAAAGAFGELGLPPTPGGFAGADGRGGIAQSVATMNGQLQQAEQQVAAALQQNGGAVIQTLSQMQTGLTGTLGGMVAKLAEINAFVQGLQGTINGIQTRDR